MIVRAGIYVRTSRSEENKDDRRSIKTQIEGLRKYCNDKNYKIIKIYSDENFSGTNFNRPAFLEMIEDAKEKTINTIIVKDLSRFGRNLYKMGEYLEGILPSLNIRFIAINDNIDSLNGIKDDAIYTNFFNHLYIKDIRKKVIFSIKKKAKEKSISNRKSLILGYKLNEDNNWIIDNEEALIIKRIFKEALEGKSFYKIAKGLEEDQIMTSAYRKYFKTGEINNIKHKGIKPNPDYYYKWDFSTISYIIKNRQYTGCLINKVLGEEYIIENHHEAIISKEDFIKVQRQYKGCMISTNNPLNNFIKCKKCGYAMIKERYGKHLTYQCICCKEWIDKEKIESMIEDKAIKDLNNITPTLSGNRLAKAKQKIKDKISNLEDEITSLVLEEASDKEVIIKQEEINKLKDSLNNFSMNKHIIYDVNGKALNNDELNDYKIVAKALYEKVLFLKTSTGIEMEVVRR